MKSPKVWWFIIIAWVYEFKGVNGKFLVDGLEKTTLLSAKISGLSEPASTKSQKINVYGTVTSLVHLILLWP